MPTGIAIGAGSTSRFTNLSRRLTFVGFNVLGIIGCLLSSVNTYITVILGRFIYGCVGGIMMTITPKML